MFASVHAARRVRCGFSLYVAGLAATCALIASAVALCIERGQSGLEALLAAKPALTAPREQPARTLRAETVGEMRLAQAAWHERLLRPDYWDGRGRQSLGGSPSAPALVRGFGWRDDDDEDGGTYRTVCVRLCDGYYFPISFATTPEGFQRDRQRCERSCGTAARLYVYRNPGEEPQNMRSIEGEPYARLRTAFLYRSQYVPSCKCRPDPWEDEARDRHRLYALEAARAKGDKAAAKAASELRANIASRHRPTAASANTGSGPPSAAASEAGRAVSRSQSQPINERRRVAPGFADAARSSGPAGTRTVPPADTLARGGADAPAVGTLQREASRADRATVMRLGATEVRKNAQPQPRRAAPSSAGSGADWRRQVFHSQ
jgi:hypothetical protein